MGDQSAPPTPNAPPAPDLSSLYGNSGKLVAAPPTTPASTPAPPATPSIVSRVVQGAKNLATTGDITGHPEVTEKSAEQEIKNQQTVNDAKADYKNWLYENSPQDFKAAYPAEYLYRKGYNAVESAITDSATRPLTGKAQEEIAPKIHELAEAGLGTVGLNKPGQPEPVIQQGVLLPEGGLGSEETGVEGLAKLEGKQVGQTRPDVEIRATGPDWDRTHSAYVDGKKVGSVGYKVDASGRAQIYGAQVDPQLRGQGIAQKLYGSIIDEAPTKNATRLTSDSTNTTPAANRVWQKIGEKGKAPVEEITHPNGKPGYQIDFSKPKTQAADPLDQLHGKTGKTVPDYKGIGEVTGVEFRGVQKGIEGAHPGLAIYQDPKSGTSVAVKLDEFSPKKLQEHVDLARERMNGTAQKKSAPEK